jgi:hypothetical protein
VIVTTPNCKCGSETSSALTNCAVDVSGELDSKVEITFLNFQSAEDDGWPQSMQGRKWMEQRRVARTARTGRLEIVVKALDDWRVEVFPPRHVSINRKLVG